MLFDVEKQVAVRWYIEKHNVCPGCPYHGQVKDEESFCIMRQEPPGCVIAMIARRFEKIKIMGENSMLKAKGFKNHWEQVYAKTMSDKPGWYAPHLQASLCWINQLNIPLYAPIIDVGCGISTFAEDLLEADYRSITVLDISGKALSTVKDRLGWKKRLVTWLEGDVVSVDLPVHYYELWHDRAVFHFFTEEEQRQKYRKKLLSALKPGGHLILGTFAPEAPPKCSGLPVRRYTEADLESLLGEELVLQHHRKELHVTPDGNGQMYLFCHFQRQS